MRPKAIPAYPAAKQSQTNLAFSALLLTFLGWAILERWIVGARTGPLPHLVTAVACAPVLFCALRRFHAACPRYLRVAARPGSAATGVLVPILLAAVGALFGIAACAASIGFMAVPVALCCVTPWTAVRAHQQHLFLSFLAVTAGAGAGPALAGLPPSPMAAVQAAWCLWAAAAALTIVLCGREVRWRRWS